MVYYEIVDLNQSGQKLLSTRALVLAAHDALRGSLLQRALLNSAAYMTFNIKFHACASPQLRIDRCLGRLELDDGRQDVLWNGEVELIDRLSVVIGCFY